MTSAEEKSHGGKKFKSFLTDGGEDDRAEDHDEALKRVREHHSREASCKKRTAFESDRTLKPKAEIPVIVTSPEISRPTGYSH